VPPLDVAAFLARRGVPADMAALFASMLVWDPRARITAEEALRHPALARAPTYAVPL
jgi:hypothetical protein